MMAQQTRMKTSFFFEIFDFFFFKIRDTQFTPRIGLLFSALGKERIHMKLLNTNHYVLFGTRL